MILVLDAGDHGWAAFSACRTLPLSTSTRMSDSASARAAIRLSPTPAAIVKIRERGRRTNRGDVMLGGSGSLIGPRIQRSTGGAGALFKPKMRQKQNPVVLVGTFPAGWVHSATKGRKFGRRRNALPDRVWSPTLPRGIP